ncbi:MAG: RagB/SusD family nutrient uptake outer membrane protein [Prevotella sp.]|jgi:hypothetical protein|nr:RagB/SusD family nutrient uptake outer membrane protein [Prevotella sp.]MCH3994718.1 RagB/SusD family nutrient uptake outer membrane protein [Prevotella sp.]
MKKSKYILALVLLSLIAVVSSCNGFLDENPKDEKVADKFWKTEADAESGVNALYYGGVPYLNNTDVDGGWTPKATMWGGVISGLYVDKRKDRSLTTASEGCTFTLEAFANGTESPSFKLWHEFYKGISRANFVLANIPRMTSVLSQSTIANDVAQAKFFRAYNYYYLVKEFGDVPYIDKPFTSISGMSTPRVPAKEVYDSIVKDLTSIVSGDELPNVSFYKNGCRVTKAMAQTLLAQVYLQRAGYPLNGGTTDYAKAAAMAQQVIDGGSAHLEQAGGSSDDLKSAFNVIKTTKSSDEIIYAKEYNYTDLGVGNSYACRSIGTDAFQWKDANGSSVFHPAGDVLYNAYLPCDMIINSYASNDIRGHEKQFFFRYYKDHTNLTHTLNNVGNWLWFDESALKNGHDGDLNVPMMRYSEILLIAAEGYARTGNEVEARYYLNQVRKRAGLPDDNASGNVLVQDILTERLHEMPLEFRIWDDIRRTHLYPEPSSVSGKLNWVPIATAIIQNKPEGFTKVGAIPEFALLMPIPMTEMQRNPSLTQNPGWK